MCNKKILIIGGEGYIGNVVTQNLLDSGYCVISYDNLLFNNNHCVLHKIQNPNYQFIFGDMLDIEHLSKTLDGIDGTVLLAGLVGDPITKKYPNESAAINDEGVKKVINLWTSIFPLCLNVSANC